MQSPVVFPTLVSSIDIKTCAWYNLPATHYIEVSSQDRDQQSNIRGLECINFSDGAENRNGELKEQTCIRCKHRSYSRFTTFFHS